MWRGGEECECGGEEGESVCGAAITHEVVYLFSIEVDVSTERSSGAREGEHRQRDRNRNIDTNLCVCECVCVCWRGRRGKLGCVEYINFTTVLRPMGGCSVYSHTVKDCGIFYI